VAGNSSYGPAKPGLRAADGFLFTPIVVPRGVGADAQTLDDLGRIHLDAAMLGVGERAPDFKLSSTGGEDVQLSRVFASHPATILAFYVLDFTPG